MTSGPLPHFGQEREGARIAAIVGDEEQLEVLVAGVVQQAGDELLQEFWTILERDDDRDLGVVLQRIPDAKPAGGGFDGGPVPASFQVILEGLNVEV